MMQRPSGAMRVSGDQSPLTGSSAKAHEWELSLLKVHHQAESQVHSATDPGPAGFNSVLPDNDPAAEALWGVARSFMLRNALMKGDW